MSLTVSDGVFVRPQAYDQVPPFLQRQPAEAPRCEPKPEPQPPVDLGPGYGIPPGSTLRDAASGTQSRPFDVTLSQLATAVYGTRGGPPVGWSSVTNEELAVRLGTPGQPASAQEVQAWRLTNLGFNDCTQKNAQEFRADIYTDGNGNYVLAYRGTAEGGPDWDNNFRQGLGYETQDGDKFSKTAAHTARQFAQVFGNNPGGESTNLAITGHSQGGGLATVGSLASGVPAATFDASGIHPNTWDRMDIDPQRARDIAEGGQIRAYSLSSDLLTKAQDSWITGLAAPDALGTRIVVDPAAQDVNNMFTNYGPQELKDMTPEQLALLNQGVELARHPVTGVLMSTLIAPVTTAGGTLVGGMFGNPLAGAGIGLAAAPAIVLGGGDLAYSAISHSPNALTAAMIDRQPWQAGYENPSSLGRDLQDLLPDQLKDDFARNTHDFATDVDAVVANEFANGQYVQGGASLAGDFIEGAFNSTGDTIDRYADQFAAYVDDKVDGRFGDVLATSINVTGDVFENAADFGGQVVESVADGVGWAAQGVTNFVGGLFGR